MAAAVSKNHFLRRSLRPNKDRRDKRTRPAYYRSMSDPVTAATSLEEKSLDVSQTSNSSFRTLLSRRISRVFGNTIDTEHDGRTIFFTLYQSLTYNFITILLQQ